MTSNMNVNRAEMDKAAKQIEARSQQIIKIQKDLYSQITGLMAKWKGNAADAFLGAYNGFDSRFVEVQGELDKIHEKLVDTHINYTQTEQANQDATAAINAALNG